MNTKTVSILSQWQDKIDASNAVIVKPEVKPKVKRGWAVVSPSTLFLTEEGTWSLHPTEAKITFERIAVAKALEVHGKAVYLEVLVELKS